MEEEEEEEEEEMVVVMWWRWRSEEKAAKQPRRSKSSTSRLKEMELTNPPSTHHPAPPLSLLHSSLGLLIYRSQPEINGESRGY
ncbi:hypothetical protein E2C01_073004 [Portunus trituberculatus]|uniref:Uncharacterized protein n=1 Tax=Portunus trituberculatus TaxID=210409 RepID=A0A5B7I9F2_PORTR|nr:hypothetical protein [Portunus trituberculatus]